MTRTNLHLAALAAVLLLAACGDKKNDDSPPIGSLLEAAKEKGAEIVKQEALPKPDADKPLSSYPELTSDQQLMFLYTATSKLPPDFETMAKVYSREYRQSSDAFRKNDLLQAIKPQIEQGIAQAAAQPYAWLQLEDVKLESYDFQRKGFVVKEFGQETSRFFEYGSPYKLTWANRQQVVFAPVADEAIARELEAIREKWDRKPRLKVFFFAQSADLDKQQINAFVTRVQLIDRGGRVLAEYSPDGNIATNVPAAEEECRGNLADCMVKGF